MAGLAGPSINLGIKIKDQLSWKCNPAIAGPVFQLSWSLI